MSAFHERHPAPPSGEPWCRWCGTGPGWYADVARQALHALQVAFTLHEADSYEIEFQRVEAGRGAP